MGHFVDGGPGGPDEQRHDEQGHRHGQGTGRERGPAGQGRIHLAGIIDVIRHQTMQGSVQSREQLLARHGLVSGGRCLAEILAQARRHAGGGTLLPLGIPHEDQAEHLQDAGEQRTLPGLPVRYGSLGRQRRKDIFRRPGFNTVTALRRGIRLTGVHPSPPSRQRLPREPPAPFPGQTSWLRRRCRASASGWRHAARTSAACRSP